jgi:integrase
VRLGSEAEGWTQARADQALADTLADVRRGIWTPPEPVPVRRDMPSFHEFASEWYAAREGELRPKSLAHLRWALTDHLLGFFAEYPLDRIGVADIDRYVQAKVRQGRLSAASINKTVTVMGSILETAVEYDLVARNVARGRRRRLQASRPGRPVLQTAEQIAALLDGAGALDRRALTQPGQRRALLATLVFAGLRISELLALRWEDVNLARGVVIVRSGKTNAAARTVHVLPVLRDELTEWAATIPDRNPASLVFCASTGRAQSADNVRERVLRRAITKANERLAKDEDGNPRPDPDLIPTNLTPHGLRRTYASLLFAYGESPVHVMEQMGHASATLTLAVCARVMSRRDGEPERLAALVDGEEFRRASGGMRDRRTRRASART